MSNSDETLEQPTETDLNQVLKAINGFKQEVNDRFEKFETQFNGFEKATNIQLEAIRQGLVDNSIVFDRLQGQFMLLRSEFTTLTEEIRHNRKVLV